MVGKFIFRTKKLLSLLSFGVIFFIAIEIWLSHKKMDASEPNDLKMERQTDENFVTLNKRKHQELSEGAHDHRKTKSSRSPHPGKYDQSNGVNEIYEGTEFDNSYRNRTDFRGGGEEVEGDGGNYVESEYENPDNARESYEVQEENHISCKINGDYTIQCLKEGNEVYVPFSFIKKYFEISGELVLNRKGVEELMWKHSYAKVYEVYHSDLQEKRKRKANDYNPAGIFMSFEHYRVEIRDRVKCISAKEGVPISKQWGAQGYFYPIQIAQFGLSHYSKMLIESKREFYPLGVSKPEWLFAGDDDGGEDFELNGRASLAVVAPNSMNKGLRGVEVHFNISESLGPNVFYYFDIPKNFSYQISSENLDFLSFEMKPVSNATLTVVLKTMSGDEYRIHYVTSETTFLVDEQDIYYGMGTGAEWHKLTRDLKIDFQKSIPKKLRKKFSQKVFQLSLLRIELRGSGSVRNIQISNQDHLSLFYHSANWMVKNQDSKGGWPIPVSRVLVKDAMSLNPGWYSAMAQGHAMSLLSRAYSQSRKPIYLRSAYQAINPFLIRSSEGGVLAYLFGQHPWFEEYPTSPPSFVINGFMYALFGLYDLWKTLESFGITSETAILEDGLPLEWLTKLDDDSYKKLSSDSANNISQNQPSIKESNIRESGSSNVSDTSEPFQDSNLVSDRVGGAPQLWNGILGRKLHAREVHDLKDANHEETQNLLNPADYENKEEDNRITDQKIAGSFPQNNIDATLTGPRNGSLPVNSAEDHLSMPKSRNIGSAKRLFETGLKTLKLALPLFDSGSGSFYDLRHFSVPGCAPNRARWDYHSTHISQLIMASAIDEDPLGRELFQKTISRWMSYMKGKRAPHN